MALRFIHKQKAQLSLSFLPIGDTPVQRLFTQSTIHILMNELRNLFFRMEK